MPIKQCSTDGKPGWKFGDSGACYPYAAGDEKASMEAKKRAIAQGLAIGHGVLKEGKKGDRVMLSLPIPEHIAKAMGERQIPHHEMHMTLAYMGRTTDLPRHAVKKALAVAKEVAGRWPVMKAKLGGVGMFKPSTFSDGKTPIYASFNAVDLPAMRQDLIDGFQADGVPYKNNHGFTPHVTTDYMDPGQDPSFPQTPDDEFDVPCIRLTIGDCCIDIPFTGGGDYQDLEEDPISETDIAAMKMLGINVVEKESPAPMDVNVVGTEPDKRLVYGVVLEPGSIDEQDQTLDDQGVEFAAHHFLAIQGIMAYRHRTPMSGGGAVVVESYIAPVDFEMGGQVVKKGSWVLVSRVDDENVWQQIVSGEITGYSVGGWSTVRPLAPSGKNG